MKCGKSAGPVLLLNEFLKYGINGLIENIHVLFSKIFYSGIFRMHGVRDTLSLYTKREVLRMLRITGASLFLV